MGGHYSIHWGLKRCVANCRNVSYRFNILFCDFLPFLSGQRSSLRKFKSGFSLLFWFGGINFPLLYVRDASNILAVFSIGPESRLIPEVDSIIFVRVKIASGRDVPVVEIVAVGILIACILMLVMMIVMMLMPDHGRTVVAVAVSGIESQWSCLSLDLIGLAEGFNDFWTELTIVRARPLVLRSVVWS